MVVTTLPTITFLGAAPPNQVISKGQLKNQCDTKRRTNIRQRLQSQTVQDSLEILSSRQREPTQRHCAVFFHLCQQRSLVCTQERQQILLGNTHSWRQHQRKRSVFKLALFFGSRRLNVFNQREKRLECHSVYMLIREQVQNGLSQSTNEIQKKN